MNRYLKALLQTLFVLLAAGIIGTCVIGGFYMWVGIFAYFQLSSECAVLFILPIALFVCIYFSLLEDCKQKGSKKILLKKGKKK